MRASPGASIEDRGGALAPDDGASQPDSRYPRGWLVAGFSEELAAGAVMPLRYFGRDLVLYRTESGEPRALDAHCPHLGAHMGHGGRVEGDVLVCPFHAWRWGAGGACAGIPYAKRIPPRASVGAWPVRERNGILFVAYGGAPDWEIPELPECSDPTWRTWSWERIEVRTHSREIVENVVDIAHFVPVHQTDPAEFVNEFDGHVAIQRAHGKGAEDHLYPGAPYSLTATYTGPGYQITEFESRGATALLLNAHTMIEPGRLHLWFGVMVRELPNARHTDRFVEAYVADLSRGFQQDIAIWEHKRFRDEPCLVDGDGDIGALRRWYRQFYEAP